MIELKQDALFFSFPEVHERARLRIEFQRTLRIPDDGRDYPLPPGLGRFPVRHVDDFAKEVPEVWLRHGGVTLPMYQSEAMWLNENSTNENALMVRGLSLVFLITTSQISASSPLGTNRVLVAVIPLYLHLNLE